MKLRYFCLKRVGVVTIPALARVQFFRDIVF